MKFRFEPLRAAQAAGVLVRLADGRLNYTKLIKLLHLADRQSLKDTGSPITGDTVVNMANGPVLSNVYRCIKNEAPQFTSWERSFRTDGYDLVLAHDPGEDELSEYDIKILTDLYEQYRTYNYSRMIDVAHTLPEWKDPAPAKVQALSHREILEAARVPAEQISAYEDLNASVRQVDALRVIRP